MTTATKDTIADVVAEQLGSILSKAAAHAGRATGGEWQAAKDLYTLGFKHTTPTGTPTTNYTSGPGGIFGVSGLERDVISTRVQPRGLIGMLPATGSMRTDPLFAYLTGFQADTGSDPNGVCDDCQTAGLAKSCLQTAAFGRYCFMTKELELNRIGQQTDRGELLDLRMLNEPLLEQGGGVLQQNLPGGFSLQREVQNAMQSVGISFQNKLIQQLYIGNPANNSAGGGYKEFPGLDILIGTAKVDAITNTECPSLDSDIKDFNYGLVDDLAANADIVEVVTYMFRFLRHNADRMNLTPTNWVITMRQELFYELTAVWPCAYFTWRCAIRAGDTQVRANVDAPDMVRLRDQMREGMFLLIDGIQVPVVTDDGIAEETDADNASIAAGEFASDIYFIPLTVAGGFASTYMEYLDYTQGPIQAVQDGRLGAWFWTDGGRYLWHAKPPLNWCVQWLSKIEPRVILRTPQLAGRITNVRYAPLQHTRDPFPDDPYFVDGGETSRAGPSLFADWKS
jgi:hypothetical protein